MNAIKFRILGVLIIVALVIMLLPLIESKDSTTQKMAIAVPPFPDEAVQVDAEPATIALPATGEPAPLPKPLNTANQDIEKTGYIKPSIINQSAQDLFEAEEINHTAAHTEEQLAKTQVLPRAPARANVFLTKSVASARKKEEAPITKLKSTGWVIQIGSFNDKANALRLVNQLRNNGYSAFIQQVGTAFGSHTRVLIGPLNQQEAANQMANKLEDQLHIKGIVVNYKPLEL